MYNYIGIITQHSGVYSEDSYIGLTKLVLIFDLVNIRKNTMNNAYEPTNKKNYTKKKEWR